MRTTLWSNEMIKLEPYRRYADTPVDEHDGYALLVASVELGLTWVYLTNEQMARVLWRTEEAGDGERTALPGMFRRLARH